MITGPPIRCFTDDERSVVVPVSDTDVRGRALADPLSARIIQWFALRDPVRDRLACHVVRSATLGSGVSAVPALANVRMLRDAGSGSSGRASDGGGSRGRTHGCHHRQPDPVIHAGEWPARDTTGTSASAAPNFTWRLIRSGKAAAVAQSA
jgi:hypothetical protein